MYIYIYVYLFMYMYTQTIIKHHNETNDSMMRFKAFNCQDLPGRSTSDKTDARTRGHMSLPGHTVRNCATLADEYGGVSMKHSAQVKATNRQG